MSPRWAKIGNAGLYFYPSEPHGRPHVDVVGPDYDVKIALDTFERLHESGKVPRATLREVEKLLRDNLDLAIEAYHAAREHRFPGTLREQKEDLR